VICAAISLEFDKTTAQTSAATLKILRIQRPFLIDRDFDSDRIVTKLPGRLMQNGRRLGTL
jgi:hypothetical protein